MIGVKSKNPSRIGNQKAVKRWWQITWSRNNHTQSETKRQSDSLYLIIIQNRSILKILHGHNRQSRCKSLSILLRPPTHYDQCLQFRKRRRLVQILHPKAVSCSYNNPSTKIPKKKSEVSWQKLLQTTRMIL